MLYIVVAIVAVGALPADKLGNADAPLATALSEGAGYSWGSVVSIGAVVAITSVVLTITYGLTRIVYSMSRDGLLPKLFSKVGASTRRRR